MKIALSRIKRAPGSAAQLRWANSGVLLEFDLGGVKYPGSLSFNPVPFQKTIDLGSGLLSNNLLFYLG
jgi:hypothetical protein